MVEIFLASTQYLYDLRTQSLGLSSSEEDYWQQLIARSV